MASVSFARLKHADLPLLSAWMEQPHWRAWWGDPATELHDIVEMIEGRDTTEPYIFHVDSQPTGYIQVWLIDCHQTAEWTNAYPWLLELPGDAVGVDLSIGNETELGKGIGSMVLAAFVAMLRRRGHTTILIDPDPANARAIRAYEKAGFKPISRLLGRFDGVLLMQHETD